MPAAHYNNKIQENKTKSNPKFAIKRTTIQISFNCLLKEAAERVCYMLYYTIYTFQVGYGTSERAYAISY